MEMRRAVRPSGIVAAYVWDFEPELSPSGPLRAALKAEGIRVPVTCSRVFGPSIS